MKANTKMRALASHWARMRELGIAWRFLISLHFRAYKVALCAPEFFHTGFNHLKITVWNHLKLKLRVFL